MNGATLIVFGRIFPILVSAPLFIPWQRPIEGLEGLEKLDALEGLDVLEELEGLEGLEGLEKLDALEGLDALEELEGLGGFLGDCHYTLGSDADYFYLKTKKN